MNKIAIIIFIFATLILKFIVNDSCYNILRENHSKTYIKKNYSGFKNWLFYKDYRKEVGLLFYINLVILLAIFLLSSMFVLCLFIRIDITILLKILSVFFGMLCLINFVYIIVKFIVTGIDGRGEKVGIPGRLIMLGLAIFLIILILL